MTSPKAPTPARPWPVTSTLHGNVALVTLDDPSHRNILTASMVQGLACALDDVETDPTVTCVVLTGAGRAFCAGAELATLERSASGDFASVKQVYEGFLRVLASPLPTIAAINGPAVGAGLNLALACDVAVAAESAHFDTRFTALRLHPGGGHTWLLSRAIGHQKAMLADLFGNTWTARQALLDGLVADVVPDAELVSTTIGIGNRIADVDRALVERLTSTVRGARESGTHAEVLAAETVAQEWSVTQPAFVEHVRALAAAIASRRPRD